MAYTTGLLNHRISVLNRTEATSNRFGRDGGGIEWNTTGELWASVDFSRGKSAMNAGALDVYAVVIVRMRWFTPSVINMRSRIIHDGVTYQIIPETFHADRLKNQIQFHAQAVVE